MRWVLGTSRRLEVAVGLGRVEEAKRDWEEVRGILLKWRDVAGVDELRDECEKIMSRV